MLRFVRRISVGKLLFRGAGVLAALLLLLWFASVHYTQRVTLDLGVFVLRQVPLPFALYGAVIVGMAFMLLIGLRADLETRRLLQRYQAIAELERAAQRVRASADERDEEAASRDGENGAQAELGLEEDAPHGARPD